MLMEETMNNDDYICKIIINHKRVNVEAGLFEVGVLESFLCDILRLVYELEIDGLSIYSELMCNIYSESKSKFRNKDIVMSVEVCDGSVASISLETCRIDDLARDFDIRCHCIKDIDAEDYEDYGFFDMRVSEEFKCNRK